MVQDSRSRGACSSAEPLDPTTGCDWGERCAPFAEEGRFIDSQHILGYLWPSGGWQSVRHSARLLQ